MSEYKYLDKAGLTTLWSKIKSYISSLGYTTNKGTVGGSGTSGYLAKENKNTNSKRYVYPRVHYSIIYNIQIQKQL